MPDEHTPRDEYWEDPAQVARFAEREADRRLAALLPSFPDPARTRVLDLGCAGGRNAALLALKGFDVHALDASAAMVAHTRERLAAVLGVAEAERRVRQGRMDDLTSTGAPRRASPTCSRPRNSTPRWPATGSCLRECRRP